MQVLPPLQDRSAVPTPAGGEAALFVTVHTTALPAALPEHPAPTGLRVTLSKPRTKSTDQTLQRHVPFRTDAGPVSVSFTNIGTGRWSIQAELIDEDGISMYAGTGEAYVEDGSTVQAELVLDPLPGTLTVEIELGDDCILVLDESGCLVDVTEAGRLDVSPPPSDNKKSESFDWTEGDTRGTVSITSIPARHYEFQVTFFNGNRIDSNIIYRGHWIPVVVHPGHTTTVVWEPQTGALDIRVHVHLPPGSPTDLTATWSEDGVRLDWGGATASDVTHYNVWRRTDPKAEMEKIAEAVGWMTTSWLDQDAPWIQCGDASDEKLYYVVTAVNESGLESLRSNEVTVCANSAAPE